MALFKNKGVRSMSKTKKDKDAARHTRMSICLTVIFGGIFLLGIGSLINVEFRDTVLTFIEAFGNTFKGITK